jgi:hypothetical protein
MEIEMEPNPIDPATKSLVEEYRDSIEKLKKELLKKDGEYREL